MRIGTLPRVAMLVRKVGAGAVARRLRKTGTLGTCSATFSDQAHPQRRPADAIEDEDTYITFRVPGRCACGCSSRGCRQKRAVIAGPVRAYVLARVALVMAKKLRCPCYEAAMLNDGYILPPPIHQGVAMVFWRWIVRDARQKNLAVWWPMVRACLTLFRAPPKVSIRATVALMHVLPRGQR